MLSAKLLEERPTLHLDLQLDLFFIHHHPKHGDIQNSVTAPDQGCRSLKSARTIVCLFWSYLCAPLAPSLAVRPAPSAAITQIKPGRIIIDPAQQSEVLRQPLLKRSAIRANPVAFQRCDPASEVKQPRPNTKPASSQIIDPSRWLGPVLEGGRASSSVSPLAVGRCFFAIEELSGRY